MLFSDASFDDRKTVSTSAGGCPDSDGTVPDTVVAGCCYTRRAGLSETSAILTGLTEERSLDFRSIVLRIATALTASVLLVSCAAPNGNFPTMSPLAPIKGAAVAAVAVGSALDLRSHTGKPEVRALREDAFADNRLTWLGHSSFLLRIGGLSILLDPMFSDKPQVSLPIRPTRITPVPPGIETLDRLDAVVVSHADHDHLDLPTLRSLAARFPNAVLLVPEETESLAKKAGFTTNIELGTYESYRIGSVAFTALPSHHYGRRDLIGLNRTLALGWEIRSAGHKTYFSGDTAYGPQFKEIRKRRGRYDVALVSIGSYGPWPLFEDIHSTPEQAMKIAEDLGAPIAIGHHWGTFAFGTEQPREASRRFLEARRAGITARILAVGETIPLR